MLRLILNYSLFHSCCLIVGGFSGTGRGESPHTIWLGWYPNWTDSLVMPLCVRVSFYRVTLWAGHRTSDRMVACSTPGLALLRNNLTQFVHTRVPPSPSSITWYWPRDMWCSSDGKVAAGMMESNSNLLPGLSLTTCSLADGLGWVPGARNRVRHPTVEFMIKHGALYCNSYTCELSVCLITGINSSPLRSRYTSMRPTFVFVFVFLFINSSRIWYTIQSKFTFLSVQCKYLLLEVKLVMCICFNQSIIYLFWEAQETSTMYNTLLNRTQRHEALTGARN